MRLLRDIGTGDAERAAAPADLARAREQSFARAVQETGRPLPAQRAAVLLGAAAGEGLGMLRRLRVDLPVLLAGADASRLAPDDRAWLADAGDVRQGVDVTLAREVLAFLRAERVSLRDLLVWEVDPGSPATAPTGAARRTLEDLRYGVAGELSRALSHGELTGTAVDALVDGLGAVRDRAGAALHLTAAAAARGSDAGWVDAAAAWVRAGSDLLATHCLAEARGSGTERSRVAAEAEALRARLEPERDRVFGANAAALGGSAPRLVAQLEAARAASRRVVAVRLADVPSVVRLSARPAISRGDAFVLLAAGEGGLQVVGHPRSPLQVFDALSRVRAHRDAHVLVGSLLAPDVLQNVARNRFDFGMPGFVQAIYVAEPRLEVAVAVLEAIDLTAVWRREGVVVGIGSDGVQALVDGFVDRPLRHLPRLWLDVPSNLGAVLKAVHDHREEALAVARGANARGYGEEVAAPRRQRVTAGGPLSVLLLGSRYTTVVQHVVRDLARALDALGHRSTILQEADGLESVYPEHLAASIAASDPDALVVIGHVRGEYRDAIPGGLPVVSWIQDAMTHLFQHGNAASVRPHDLVYVINPGLLEALRAHGYPDLRLLRFGVNTDLYAPAERSAAPCDEVAFITHVPLPPEPAATPGLFRWLEERFEEQPEESPARGDWVDPLVDQYLTLAGVAPSEAQRTAIRFEANRFARFVERVRYADWMREAGIPMALYGRGWHEVERLRFAARGEVASGEPLRDVYRRSKVVLHVNRYMNVHNRVLEGLASGSFVLARSEPNDREPGELGDCLSLGREVVTFSGREDFVAKIRRAFEDESWRMGVVRAARARILGDHRYESRVATVLSDLRQKLA